MLRRWGLRGELRPRSKPLFSLAITRRHSSCSSVYATDSTILDWLLVGSQSREARHPAQARTNLLLFCLSADFGSNFSLRDGRAVLVSFQPQCILVLGVLGTGPFRSRPIDPFSSKATKKPDALDRLVAWAKTTCVCFQTRRFK